MGATLAPIREQQQQMSARLLEHAAMAAMEGETRPTPQRLEDERSFIYAPATARAGGAATR